MDGFEVLDELRRRVEWREIPVVVVTAKDLTEEDHRRLSGRGAHVKILCVQLGASVTCGAPPGRERPR